MNLEKISIKISKLQIKSPMKFLTVLSVIILVMIPGMVLLPFNIEPSLEKVLPQSEPEVKTMNDMRSLFGADMMYLVITPKEKITDLRDPSVVNYIDILSRKIETEEHILDVTSIAEITKREGNIPGSKSKIERIIEDSSRSDSLINYDYSMTVIEIKSDTGANSDLIDKVVKSIERNIEHSEEFNPGVDTKITGFNAIDRATFGVIIKDFAYITIFSFLFMAGFLILYFRSWRKALGSLFTIGTSVIITLGLTGYIGITITVVTMVAAAMIMALGISYGINVTYEYYLERKEKNKEDSLLMLNKHMIRALLGSSLTTSAGFLALLFGVIPAMKNLGIVLAMGIIVTLSISVFFLPVVIYLLDNEKSKIR